MKQLNFISGIYLFIFLLSGCSNTNSVNSEITNCDPALVGKWIRKNKYHLELYSNGIGSNNKNVLVTDDIKKFKNERINWATFNNNFMIINSDEKIMGFSYQVKGDTLFLRRPEDNLEYFIKVKDENKKSE